MTIKAIIFDVDGTLADTEDGHRKSFNKAFAENGLDWNWDVALYDKLLKVTGGKERIKYFVDSFMTGFQQAGRFRRTSSNICTRPRPRITPRCCARGIFRCAPASSS